jgi:hypothetical protein
VTDQDDRVVYVADSSQVSSTMSASGAVIDLSDDTLVVSEARKKRKIEHPRLENVWIAFHQLEATYHGVGDFSDDRGCLSHVPTMFDKTILGLFVTRGGANRCANETWLNIRGDEDENDDDDDDDNCPDFVGEGKFKDGVDSGDVNTFSERVVVEMKKITYE